jgi:hypothetical protein
MPNQRAHQQRLRAAQAALDQGDITAAEHEAEALCRENPSQPGGFVLQARCAAARGDAACIALWRGVIARFDDRPHAAWRLALCRALLAHGHASEAANTLRAHLAKNPEDQAARALLLHTLIETNDKPGATAALAARLFAHPAERLRLHLWLGNIQGARATFATALDEATDADTQSRLFAAIPVTFEAYGRAEAWRALRARIPQANDPATITLRARIDLALRDHEIFLATIAAAPPLPAPWGPRFARLAEILRAPAFPDFGAPRVYGIGLTKTATSTLAAALESLGYLQAHFTNPFTHEIIAEDDFPLFDAVTDTPAALRFETLAHTYENAKFILTERPLETWAQSFERHFQRSDGGYAKFRAKAARPGQLRYGADLARLHAGLYFPHPTPQAAYAAHTTRVEAFFATRPAQLLRHNAFTGDGWPALCAFLDKPIPPTSYPWRNRSELETSS